MGQKYTRKLITENGHEFFGTAFGANREAVCELVFNTSMVGYQEIVSDPSYTDQAVVMTYPLIGNYGMTDEDYETRTPSVSGLVVREYASKTSPLTFSTLILNSSFFFSRIITVALSILYPPPIITG